MKQFEVLKWAFSFLQAHGREAKVAEILLQHVIGQSTSQFYTNMQSELSDAEVACFKEFVKEHAQTGKPVQHLLGYTYFYGRKFMVNKHVLIPRFETEELVQAVITYIERTFQERKEPLTIVDLGTGSGVIAITLKLAFPQLNVIATDISSEALAVAKQNAASHHAPITWLQGDFLQPVYEQNIQPHIIVSNPPYIAEHERNQLADTVKNFDPELALFAGADGLQAYKTILEQIATYELRQIEALFFEIGYAQGKIVQQLIAKQFPHSRPQVLQDINGNNRVVVAKLKSCC